MEIDLRPGDVYLLAAESRLLHFDGALQTAIKIAQLLNRLVRRWPSRYRIVHVGLARGDECGHEAIEALPDVGVVRHPLPAALDRIADGGLRAWIVPVDCRLADPSPAGGARRMWDHVAGYAADRRGYDYIGAVRSVGLLERWAGAGRRGDDRLFCSEAVAEAAVRTVWPGLAPPQWDNRVGFLARNPHCQTPARVAAWPLWDWRLAIRVPYAPED